MFDHHHGIGPGGNRRAGHDSRRAAADHFTRRNGAGGHFFQHVEFGLSLGQIGRSDGISVDDRLVVRRRIDVADDVLGQHQPTRLARGTLLGRPGPGTLEHSFQCFLDTQHGVRFAGRYCCGPHLGFRRGRDGPARTGPRGNFQKPLQQLRARGRKETLRMKLQTEQGIAAMSNSHDLPRAVGASLQAQATSSGLSVSGRITRLW